MSEPNLSRAPVFFALLIAISAAVNARADSLTLAWDPSSEPQAFGYYVFIGTVPGNYSTVVDVGSSTQYTFTAVAPSTTYFLTVAAYTADRQVGQRAGELVMTTGGAPTLANPGNRSSSQGVPVALTLSATDAASESIVLAATGLPLGLSLNAQTGVISGVPTTTGTFTVSATATDNAGNATTQSFTWTIHAADSAAPTIRISAPTSASSYATAESFVLLSGVASDDVGLSSVTWVNSRGGSGTAAGTTNWSVVVPLQSGFNTVTISATDSMNRSSFAVINVMSNVSMKVAPGLRRRFVVRAQGLVSSSQDAPDSSDPDPMT